MSLFGPYFLHIEKNQCPDKNWEFLSYISMINNAIINFLVSHLELLEEKFLTSFLFYSIFWRITYWLNSFLVLISYKIWGKNGYFFSNCVWIYIFCILYVSCYYTANTASWNYFRPFVFSYKNWVILSFSKLISWQLLTATKL